MPYNKARYTEAAGQSQTDRTWPDRTLAVGDYIEGRYLERRTNIGTHRKNVYVVQTIDAKVGIWGSTVLDSKFESIAEGSQVCVEYKGLVTSHSGTQYKDFYVGIDTSVQPVANPLSPRTVVDDDIPF